MIRDYPNANHSHIWCPVEDCWNRNTRWRRGISDQWFVYLLSVDLLGHLDASTRAVLEERLTHDPEWQICHHVTAFDRVFDPASEIGACSSLHQLLPDPVMSYPTLRIRNCSKLCMGAITRSCPTAPISPLPSTTYLPCRTPSTSGSMWGLAPLALPSHASTVPYCTQVHMRSVHGDLQQITVSLSSLHLTSGVASAPRSKIVWKALLSKLGM